MKKLILIVSLIVSTSALADLIKFTCKANDVDGIHKFDARGVVVVDDFNKVEGIINLQVKKAGEDQSIQIYEQLNISGVLKHFSAGKITQKAFDQLVLKSENNYLKNINISLNVEIPFISQIATIDNFLYRSNCFTDPE